MKARRTTDESSLAIAPWAGIIPLPNCGISGSHSHGAEDHFDARTKITRALSSTVTRCPQFEVCRISVRAVAVLVMHRLARQQLATKHLFQDVPVQRDAAAIHGNLRVAVFVTPRLARARAIGTAARAKATHLGIEPPSGITRATILTNLAHALLRR